MRHSVRTVGDGGVRFAGNRRCDPGQNMIFGVLLNAEGKGVALVDTDRLAAECVSPEVVRDWIIELQELYDKFPAPKEEGIKSIRRTKPVLL